MPGLWRAQHPSPARGMPTFVAQLRGVNVGAVRRVPMAEWRALLEGLGYTRVSTLLNSGNAVFVVEDGTPTRLAEDIAAALSKKLPFEVPVVVKSAEQWADVVAGNKLARAVTDPSRLLVAIAQDSRALTDLSALKPLATPPEQFLLGKYAAYLHCPNGILKSRAGKALLDGLDKIGSAVTTRNWATVLKLQALVQERQRAPARGHHEG
jgi:uncharacterized protein (DUF1697 family)